MASKRDAPTDAPSAKRVALDDRVINALESIAHSMERCAARLESMTDQTHPHSIAQIMATMAQGMSEITSNTNELHHMRAALTTVGKGIAEVEGALSRVETSIDKVDLRT